MFAVLYRGYVKPGFEEKYKHYWKIVADYFVKERGSLGSTLHKTQDGLWIAYSKWPSKQHRDSSWPQDNEKANKEFPLPIKEAIANLKFCLDTKEEFPEICMEIIEEIKK